MILCEKMMVVVVVAEAGEEEVEVRDPFDSSRKLAINDDCQTLMDPARLAQISGPKPQFWLTSRLPLAGPPVLPAAA